VRWTINPLLNTISPSPKSSTVHPTWAITWCASRS
jgi:hypothetical protein